METTSTTPAPCPKSDIMAAPTSASSSSDNDNDNEQQAAANCAEAVTSSASMEGPSSTSTINHRHQQQPMQPPQNTEHPHITTATGLISPLTLLKHSNNNKNNNTNKLIKKKSSLFHPTTPKPHTHPHSPKPHHAHARRTMEQSLPTTPQVDSYAISKISQAREKIKRSFDRSKLLERDEYVFPRFGMEELTLGELLGRGGFGTVMEIRRMELCREEREAMEMEEEEATAKREGDGPENNHGQFTEKAKVYKIDELSEEESEDCAHSSRRGKRGQYPIRKKSHSFRLRRPHLHLNHSHDGCEGLSSPQGEGGGSSSADPSSLDAGDRAVKLSKSHDGLEGGDHCNDDDPDDVPSSTRSDSAATKKPQKHHPHRGGIHLKNTLSWNHAKAAAHDVSHFFHLPSSSKNHHGNNHHNTKDAAAAVAAEESVEVLLHHQEEKKETSDDHNLPIDGEQGEKKLSPPPPVSKKVSYDDSSGPSMSESTNNDGGVDNNGAAAGAEEAAADPSEGGGGNNGKQPVARKRASSNFSFVAWRDSEAGNEGEDAISPEELEKYNIIPPLPLVNSTFSLDGEDGKKEERKGEEDNDTSVAGNRKRRVVLKSTPTDDGTTPNTAPHSKEEEDPSTLAATIVNAAYYGGYSRDKAYLTTHTTNSSGEARYAIKIISPHIVENDFKKFLQAAMDMATETYFLSVLDHDHILKLRAVGQGDMFSPRYFLVLDRLYDTLSDRIEGAWQQQRDHLVHSIFVWNRARKLRALWDERMTVMKDLAGALNYLHQLNIIYRDIKPENVGFDARGNVKLFDFGLAKECHEEDECANGTYKLTPSTGSIRYMAPENGNAWPYNFYADSYSFGIMLWEISSLERPFAHYTPREIRDMVMKWGERPKMNDAWSDRVRDLMKRCWDSNFRKRPSMEAIRETLEKEIGDSSS